MCTYVICLRAAVILRDRNENAAKSHWSHVTQAFHHSVEEWMGSLAASPDKWSSSLYWLSHWLGNQLHSCATITTAPVFRLAPCSVRSRNGRRTLGDTLSWGKGRTWEGAEALRQLHAPNLWIANSIRGLSCRPPGVNRRDSHMWRKVSLHIKGSHRSLWWRWQCTLIFHCCGSRNWDIDFRVENDYAEGSENHIWMFSMKWKLHLR